MWPPIRCGKLSGRSEVSDDGAVQDPCLAAGPEQTRLRMNDYVGRDTTHEFPVAALVLESLAEPARFQQVTVALGNAARNIDTVKSTGGKDKITRHLASSAQSGEAS